MDAVNYCCTGVGDIDLLNLKNGMIKIGNSGNKESIFPAYFHESQLLIKSMILRYKDLFNIDLYKIVNEIFERGVSYNFKVIIDMDNERDTDIIYKAMDTIVTSFRRYDDHAKHGKIIFFLANCCEDIYVEISSAEVFYMKDLNQSLENGEYIYQKICSSNVGEVLKKMNEAFLQENSILLDFSEEIDLIKTTEVICWIKDNILLKKRRNIRLLPNYFNAFLLGEWEGLANPIEVTSDDIVFEHFMTLNEVLEKRDVKVDLFEQYYKQLIRR